MCKLLMSINPQHVRGILSGTKQFEYRKVKCKKSVDSIVIYSTSPIMKVVAEVEVTGIIEGSPQNVWNSTCFGAGIDKSFFDEYYKGKDFAVAYKLGHITKFHEPLHLADFGIKTAPQSFVYIR